MSTETTTIRGAFVNEFGEDNAAAIETAAAQHANGVNDENRGSDPFKWALLIAIGYECMTRYAGYHGVTADPYALKAWVFENADLVSHDGDCDYIAALAGGYEGWVKTDGAE